MTANPYAKYVDGLNVLQCLEDTPKRIESLVRAWPREKDERSHAPGKWTARQVLTHLAHIEMVFALRLRFALAQDGYVIQPFEQDDWMNNESGQTALAGLDCYVALRRMNLALCQSLAPAQRTKTLTHPEFGAIDVNWLMAWAAGHERNHLPQIEAVAAG
jgi:DinB family protein